MSTLAILIIGHAEKPGESWPGPGLTPDGTPDKKSLVVRGWQRANSWAALFGGRLGGQDYPKPSAIYAADPAGTSGDEPSQRPIVWFTRRVSSIERREISIAWRAKPQESG